MIERVRAKIDVCEKLIMLVYLYYGLFDVGIFVIKISIFENTSDMKSLMK